LRSILKSAPSWAFGALFLLALGSTAIAQTDIETEPSSNAPGASPPEQVSPSEQCERSRGHAPESLCGGGRRSHKGDGAAAAADQMSLLQQLSQLRGQNFDSLYASSVKETLAQLQTLFRDFGEGGGDAGLRAIAKWELPKLEETISALNAM
jgi:hypothetical protein